MQTVRVHVTSWGEVALSPTWYSESGFIDRSQRLKFDGTFPSSDFFLILRFLFANTGIGNVANKARSTRGADKQHGGPDGKVKAYPKTKVTERWRARPASLGRIPTIHEAKERYV